MKFSICVKQVPDVAASIRIRDGALEVDPGRYVLNAYDASAVEAALQLVDGHGGEVEVVSVGPDRAQDAIRKVLAMGASSGVHLKISDDATVDSFAVARSLAEFYHDREVDVIACGKQSQDTDAGLTGSMLAALLDLPYVTNAVAIKIEGDTLVATRQGDTGREEIALPTPCLVTCSNDMNDPRTPSLKGIMAAKRKPIEVRSIDAGRLDHDTRLEVLRHESVPDREPGRIIEGDVEQQVQELVRLLDTEARVI